eukprot:TRINITY_DN22410_c0_g2_i1.p1 TRINITY_DN22410_c0_g2~~TRINITY_DN22410_c0_g2_i1.p1  ORF type:complete len:385 (-),score=67.66 TRINITY_DN22410_c0_g2_i1:58-1212(-)
MCDGPDSGSRRSPVPPQDAAPARLAPRRPLTALGGRRSSSPGAASRGRGSSRPTSACPRPRSAAPFALAATGKLPSPSETVLQTAPEEARLREAAVDSGLQEQQNGSKNPQQTAPLTAPSAGRTQRPKSAGAAIAAARHRAALSELKNIKASSLAEALLLCSDGGTFKGSTHDQTLMLQCAVAGNVPLCLEPCAADTCCWRWATGQLLSDYACMRSNAHGLRSVLNEELGDSVLQQLLDLESKHDVLLERQACEVRQHVLCREECTRLQKQNRDLVERGNHNAFLLDKLRGESELQVDSLQQRVVALEAQVDAQSARVIDQLRVDLASMQVRATAATEEIVVLRGKLEHEQRMRQRLEEELARLRAPKKKKKKGTKQNAKASPR